jgi:hypothetical protein
VLEERSKHMKMMEQKKKNNGTSRTKSLSRFSSNNVTSAKHHVDLLPAADTDFN